MRFGVRQKPTKSDCQRLALTRGHAAVAMALTLAACGHLQQSADAGAKTPTLRVADAALATGAPEVALNVAQVILEKDPRNVKALIARGDAYYAMHQRALADASYQAAIGIDPNAAGAQVGLGRILAQSDPKAAEAAFLTALKSEPANIDALNNLGVVRDLTGRYAEAEDAYYHALMVAPDSVEVQINLGVSLALSGHGETALRLLRGVASDPDAVQAWRNELSHALAVAGDPALAQQLAQGDPAPAPDAPAPDAPAPMVVAAAPKPPAAPAIVAPAPAQPATASAAPDESAFLPPEALRPAPLVAVARSELPAVVATAPPAIAMQDAVAPMPAPILPAAAPVQPHAAPSVKLTKTAAIADARVFSSARAASSNTEAFVQLGSLNSEADARFEWERLTKLTSSLLTGHEPIVTQAEVRGRTYWRLRTFGFASADAATELCGQLKAMAQRCWSGRGL